jgi:hypothetical protein
MATLIFVFINLLIIACYDCYKMAKSEMIYWGYGVDSGAFNQLASDAASISQFILWYIYVFITAFAILPFFTALLNIALIGLLHWCGMEDLFFFLWARWIKLPIKYLAIHPTFNFLGFAIPTSLYWLSIPRKIGSITIPSLIGKVCGNEVQGKKFLTFTLSIIFIVIVLTIII